MPFIWAGLRAVTRFQVDEPNRRCLSGCSKRKPAYWSSPDKPNGGKLVDRAEKQAMVTMLQDVFQSAGAVIVAHYAGLTVADMTELRVKMKDAGGSVKVAKNRLAKLALKDTEADHISDLLQGPTLLAYSEDPVAAPKVIAEFAKTHENLVILGGAMGATHLDVDGVKKLATMPSLDELRAKIVGMINAPATRIAQVVNAPAGQLARVFKAYSDKAA
jgi:large subunit ribosomal protein L10